MPPAAPPGLTLEPPVDQWPALVQCAPRDLALRAQLRQLVNQQAQRWGARAWPDHQEQMVVTGHQAWFWHPGIAAKNIALGAWAQHTDAMPVHLVVDQDLNDPWTLTLPTEQGDMLAATPVRLAPVRTDLPTGSQPAVDLATLQAAVAAARERFPDVMARLDAALQNLPACDTLAQQVAMVTLRLLMPLAGEQGLLFASELLSTPTGLAWVERLLTDAVAAIRAYNEAVIAHPEAGLALLSVEPERVELPVWWLPWGMPRRRVFADLADTTPLLTDEAGQPLPPSARLAPRVLLQTAVLRSGGCDLFIHGKGGGVYDQAMEAWITTWTSQTLAPRVVASADLFLSFAAPVADRAELTRAVAWRHHLPHNLHRQHPEDELSQRRGEVLQRLQQSTERPLRALLFRELHALNELLAQRYPQLLEAAAARLARARQGVANAYLARKRDWPVLAYPPAQLSQLAHALTQASQSTQPVS